MDLKEYFALEKRQKIEQFRRLNRFAKKGQIVFAGSSLAEQFPLNELMLDRGIKTVMYNRGVGGFTTQEFADNLDVLVLDLEPRKLFINIGTNDLNGSDFDIEAFAARYDGIIGSIQDTLPLTAIYMMAYYPVNEAMLAANGPAGAGFAHRTNARIDEANARVRAIADARGAGYIDVTAGLRDGSGALKAEYSKEGLHFYADGYAAIFDNLMRYALD
ncbi:GDSL-type esterase/lipase family protein [Bifidobacterium sp. SO4]|uniref:GDSL-type esterase/lipase family protein n=1 Tax=Bifidobacterium sp. SO4 TaxID=2809030 RepID=UPI001BDCD605|nr:GDSL-type esterase/lipase family protein [Bifidobacterium sp. SO4]MBT1170076.1 hypothetical protein [Bifidobacterium sp. SO4]